MQAVLQAVKPGDSEECQQQDRSWLKGTLAFVCRMLVMGTRGWLTWRSRYFATALHTSPGEIREPHTGYRGDKAVCKRLDVLSIAMKLHKVQAKSRERKLAFLGSKSQRCATRAGMTRISPWWQSVQK